MRVDKTDLPSDETDVAADDDIGHLPCDVTDAVDDNIVTYLIVTDNPKGDLTMHDVDEVYNVCLLYTSRCV